MEVVLAHKAHVLSVQSAPRIIPPNHNTHRKMHFRPHFPDSYSLVWILTKNVCKTFQT